MAPFGRIDNNELEDRQEHHIASLWAVTAPDLPFAATPAAPAVPTLHKGPTEGREHSSYIRGIAAQGTAYALEELQGDRNIAKPTIRQFGNRPVSS